MATYAILKSRVAKRVGLDETASGNDDTLLGYYLNDAVRDFLIKTRCNINRGEIAMTVETDDAEISTSVLSVNDLYVTNAAGISSPTRTTPHEIIQHRRAASGVTGSTTSLYALQGNDMLMFYPALANGDTVILYYVPRPTEMSSAAHDPSAEQYGGIPVEFHPALEMYASWQMADYDDDSSSQMGLSYEKTYSVLVRSAIKAMRRKGGRGMGPIVVGKRRLPSHDRSRDY